jgi:hypothetical protein
LFHGRADDPTGDVARFASTRDTASKVELPVKVTASLEKALASQQAKLEEVQSG